MDTDSIIYRIISILMLFNPEGIYPCDLFVHLYQFLCGASMSFFIACFSHFHEDWSGASMFPSPFIRRQFIMALLFAADPKAIPVYNSHYLGQIFQADLFLGLATAPSHHLVYQKMHLGVESCVCLQIVENPNIKGIFSVRL